MSEPPELPADDTPSTPESDSSAPPEEPEEPRTRIIRREPISSDPPTSAVSRPHPPAAPTTRLGTTIAARRPSSATAIAACAVAILSGWATAVVASDLIVGWWRTDRMFCAAVGFLTLVFAAATVTGIILTLRQRPLGRYLIAGGAAVALLTFGSLFIAGARVAWIVHTVPILQVASAVLALHPATKRWLLSA